jgi:hypothetical protein
VGKEKVQESYLWVRSLVKQCASRPLSNRGQVSTGMKKWSSVFFKHKIWLGVHMYNRSVPTFLRSEKRSFRGSARN